ncbi:MAG: histidine ammonia-lyase [Euryarchaeota archaeon]|nr:histidine ammonia-lyase [Euryarchaeota archaeon]
MNIVLDGTTLNINDVCAVIYGNPVISIAESAKEKMKLSRSIVDRIISNKEIVYGINTGFGALAEVEIDEDELSQLQYNLIRSHACGTGNLMTIGLTRAMMLIRANSLAKGYSGVQTRLVEGLEDFLNLGITPCVPEIGSLGASGDLAPLSHMALPLIGEGSCYGKNGVQSESRDILLSHGLEKIELKAKDGLSLINGTAQSSAILCSAASKIEKLFLISEIIFCLSLESKNGRIEPFYSRIHQARNHNGQGVVAERIYQMISSSNIVMNGKDKPVQDPYSFRCVPQIHGPSWDRLLRLKEALEVEINSATDNPLIFPNLRNPGENEVLSQGNFHGEVLALAADALAVSLFEIGSCSERRMDQLLGLNRKHLPPFLAQDSGLESGFMIVHYAAAANLSLLHGRILPRGAFSTPTSAGQEDHVSMSATAALNLHQAIDEFSNILACEALIASEAIEYAEDSMCPATQQLYDFIREIVPRFESDKTWSDEIREISNQLTKGKWLAAINLHL